MLAYRDEFADAGHNVKAIFKDALWIHASPTTAVSLEKRVDGEKVDVHIEAKDAINMSKHAMRETAKQVREAHGAGRVAGAGRKPLTPDTKPTPVQHTGNDPELAFAAWLHNLEVYLGEPKYAPQITGKLKELGFTLRVIK